MTDPESGPTRTTGRMFMVGYGLLSETQRDLALEGSAERLRAVVSGLEA